MFNSCKDKIDLFEDVDGGHGRIETRECRVISDPQWMKWLKEERPEWNSIQSVIKITSIFETKGKTTTEDRFILQV